MITCVWILDAESQRVDVVEAAEGSIILVLNNTAVGFESEASGHHLLALLVVPSCCDYGH